MSRNRRTFRTCLAAAVLATLISGNSWAATYNQGLTGSTDDASWLTEGTVTQTGDVVTYDFGGTSQGFTASEKDAAALYVQGNKVVIGNKQGGTRGTISFTGSNDSCMAMMGVDAIMLADGSDLTINSDLNLSAANTTVSGYSASGIFAGKLGSGEGETTKFTLNGNLTMRKNDAANPYEGGASNMYGGYSDGYTGSRWAPTGIYNGQVDGSVWNFNGNVDIAWKGTAVTTDPFYDHTSQGYSNYDNAVINMNGGSVRIDTPDDSSYGYYALANYGGTINVNATKDGAGTHDVTLLGNVITMKDPGGDNGGGDYFYRDGQTNIGLTTATSKWQGVIDNAGSDYAGEVNVWLQNGASWEHEARGKTNGLDAEHMPSPSKDHYKTYDGITHVNKLIGGSDAASAGVIFQKDAAPIEVTNYSGNTTVIYEHDAATPTTISAGDVKIASAAENSAITLLTDNTAVTTDNQDDVLNALAGKLWYTNYADNHLAGTVKIAEGLTASSAEVKSGPIKFSTASTGTNQEGQGYYEADEVVVPTEFNTNITGSDTHDQVYVDAGIKSGLNYTFPKDTTITPAMSSQDRAVVQFESGSGAMNIDATGHSLTMNAAGNSNMMLDGLLNTAGKNLTVTADQLSAKVDNTYVSTGKSYGIYAFNKSNSNVDVIGGVNIETKGEAESKGVYVNKENTYVDLQGGSGKTIKIKVNADAAEGFALSALGDNARAEVNYNRGNVRNADAIVQIDGDLYSQKKKEFEDGATSSSETSALHIGLTGQDSYLHGVMAYRADHSSYEDEDDYTTYETAYDAGDVTLLLQNGATWTNEKYASNTGDAWKEWSGSKVALLSGGSDADHAGVIFQNDSNPITVDNYSGNTTVIYKHDAANPQTINGGDFKITNAATGSAITLLTDSDGITTGFASTDEADAQNNVSEVLNKLANKLWYTNYSNGNLTGTVKIAEGLTASSAAKKTGAISFSTATTGTNQEGQGYYAYTPASDTPSEQTTTEFSQTITGDAAKDQVYTDSGVRQTDGTYKFTKDSAITLTGGASAVNVEKDVVVNAQNQTLTMTTKEGTGTVYGINQSTANKAEINADKLVLDVKSTSRAEGIHMGAANSNPALTINGDVDMTVDGTANTLGAYIQQNSTLTVNGNLKMKVDGHNGGFSYYGSSGLYGTSAMRDTIGGTIIVNGDVDLSGSMNGIFVNAGGAKATINGGGTISVDASKNPYAALRAENGVINMNVERDADGAVTGASNHKVNIKGNVDVTCGAVNSIDVHGTLSQINLGLGTADSTLQGVVYNAFPTEGITKNGVTFKGESNLWLANGATWTNEKQGKIERAWTGNNFAGSVVTNFHGGSDADHAGVIFQNDSNPITVDNYSGNTTVIYKHDAANPQTINGGDFKITNAATGSAITLLTDSDGITTGFASTDEADAQNNVSEVLNKLANKLWYTNYSNGNLTGTVKIAEGLTASSAAKKTGAISFSTATTGTNQEGQGYYAYTPLVEQLGNTIYGLADKDKKYVKEGIRQEDGTYKFTSDYTVAAVDSDVTTEDLGYNKAVGAVIANGNDITLDARGHQLTLKADSTAVSVQAIGLYSNKKVTVTADQLNVEATADKGDAEGLYVHAGGDVTINGNVSVKATQKADGSAVGINMYNDGSKLSINGNLTMKGEGDGYGVSTAQKGGYGTKKYDAKGIYMYDRTGGSVTVTGDTDMAVKGTGIDMRGSKKNIIDLQGKTTILTPIDKTDDSGSFEAINGAKGTLYIGMNAAKNGASDKDVKIQGKIYDSDAVLNIGLGTADSKWTGYVDKSDYGNGSMNLYLANGGTWDNQQTVKESVFNGSRISKLTGGSDADHAGVIFQNDSKPVTVDNYSGNTTVIYKHSIVDDTARTNHALYGDKAASVTGGDFKVTSAAAGSAITLLTDANGVDTDSTVYTDKNLVSDVLDKLANKLFFTNHASGNLSGTVKIAEGLTASSAVKKVGTISFSTTSTGTKTDGQGYYAYTLEEEPVSYKTGPIKETEDINVTRQAEANGDVNVKATNVTVTDGSYKYVSTMFAGDSSYTKSNPMVVDLNGHNLNLNAASQSNVASAIYVTDNADIKVNGSEGKKVSIHASNSDTRAANGILVKGRYAELSMDGPVEIKDISTVGDSAAGISVSSQNSSVSVSGNLTIDKVYGVRERGDGINASGIAVTGDNSKVNVTGLVDIKGVKGSSLKTVGKDTEISVGGGTITAEKDSQKNYYAVRVDKGTININMDNGAAGANTAKITGDMFVTGQYGKKVIEYSGGELIDWSDAGKLNVALTNGDSFWTGAAVYDQYNSDYGSGGNTMHDIGEFNLYLQNGAAWTNEKQSHGTTTTVSSAAWTGSQLAKLTGGSDADHAGVIYQNDTNPISVNSYSGNTTVIYKHEIVDDTAREKAAFYGNKAASVIGGDFKITNAAEGSAITLRTDSDGLNLDSSLYTDKNLVNDTLDKLANKLWYTNYSDGHLTGKVEIAEGLTASSVSKRLEDITFSTPATGTKQEGQGYYKYDLAYPDSQVTDPMDKSIDGSEDSEKAYHDAGIYKPGDDEYKFTKNPATVNGDKPSVVDGTNKDLTLKGETLNLNAQDGGTGINASDGKTVNVDNKVNITAPNGTGVKADGAGSAVNLKNGGSVQNAQTGVKADNGGSVTIGQPLDINATGHAVEAGSGAKVDLTGGTMKGGVKATGDGTEVKLNGNNESNTTKLEGGVDTGAGATVTGNFRGNGSGLEGDVTGGGTANVNVGNGASWTGDDKSDADGTTNVQVGNGGTWKGDSAGSGTANVTIADNGTWNGASTNAGTDVNLSGTWKPTGDSTVGSLTGNGGTLDKADAGSGKTTINHYSGTTNVVYGHDASNPTQIIGGSVEIGTADSGSKINLITDNTGLNPGSGKAADKNKVSETLNQMAHKLTYSGYGNNPQNLTGSLKIAEGLTAGSANLRAEALSFDSNGVGQYNYTPETNDTPIEYGDYETKLMKGAKEAMLGAIALWRSNNNDLQRRMGDLRLSKEENGIWARYLGGKNLMDGQNTKLDSRYNIYQVGYDRKVGDWTVGAALDHGKSSDSLSDGHGDGELTTLSFYGSLLKQDGQYLDIIARGSHVKDDYTVRGELGHKLDGDYKTWGLSLSAEYGKRFTQDNGFYFDPSVELTIGRLDSKDYDATSDFAGNKKMHISQDAFNSAIGRIGFGIGQELEKGNYFAKLALAHEFGGDVDTTFSAENEPTKSTHIDLGDTWYELELGGTAQLNKNTYLYGTYTRNFGAELENKWRVDAGLRFSF